MENQVVECNESVPQSTQEFNSSKSMKFDPVWVQVLINLRMKHSKLFTRRRNAASEGWKQVYQELKESGIPEYVTITKIKKKWMNLMTRYRQIKNTALNPETITWPYFEQIDRAFGKEMELDLDGRCDNSFSHSVSNDERQNFIKKLIELRHTHRHLFTGRKYTARDGWMIIQTLLQCQGKYSIDQLSKCWQNLVQRYKQILKNQHIDIITWPYFDHMQKWFNEEQCEQNCSENWKLESDVSINITESEITENKSECIKDIAKLIPMLPKNNVSVDCVKIQLLNEIKTAQEKYHIQVMDLLTNIKNHLNNSHQDIQENSTK